jgi:phosphopantothenoylcysteine decarboxylase/phosphopantothenate--cysteine ligase
LISGPTTLPLPPVEKIIKVRTAQEMHKAVLDNYKKAAIIIKAAAVADYCPKVLAAEKIKKDKKTLSLELKRNPDIIAEIGKNKGNRILVGFAMETQNLLVKAREKLKTKNMDLIVANNLQEEGAGFRTDTNIITIIDRTGKMESFEKMTKIEAAGEILDRVLKIINKKGSHKK